MGIKLDFTNVEEGGESISPGFYPATVSDMEIRKSKAGNDYFNISLKLQGDGVKGRVVYDNITLTAQAMWRMKSFLRALGWSADDLKGSLDFNPRDCLGKACVVNVGECRQGTRYNEVLSVHEEGYEPGDDAEDEDRPF